MARPGHLPKHAAAAALAAAAAALAALVALVALQAAVGRGGLSRTLGVLRARGVGASRITLPSSSHPRQERRAARAEAG